MCSPCRLKNKIKFETPKRGDDRASRYMSKSKPSKKQIKDDFFPASADVQKSSSQHKWAVKTSPNRKSTC